MLRTLYGKLAVTLILLLFVTALVYSAISYSLTRQLFIGDLQRENADLAADLAAEIPQTLGGELDAMYVEQLFRVMSYVNPDVVVYLLDPTGRIIGTSLSEDRLVRRSVPTEPLNRFLQDNRTFPLFAEDPQTGNSPVAFSVAMLQAGNKPLGYLYVTLRGKTDPNNLGHATNLLSEIGLYALLGSLLVSLLAGLYIFRRITSRLHILSGMIENFKHSGYRRSRYYRHIAKDRGHDEITRLGDSFDAMANRITEQIALLEAKDHDRRSFIANISHDLRTPLTATQGYLEILQQKYPTLSDEERLKFLGISLKHSKRLQTLIRDLFELATLEATDKNLQLETFALSDLASDVIQGYLPVAQEKDISLHYTPAADTLVEGDLALIDRAIGNLLGNALQYTQSGGAVELSVELVSYRHRDMVEFVIEDNGPGIDPVHLKNIFRRFHRADNQHASGGNAGLGLAITQRIIELHGDTLQVENTGNGTRFSFLMPAVSH